MKEIVLYCTDEKNTVTLVEDASIVEQYEEYSENERIEGNIYLGKIQRVLPRSSSCFCRYWKK